MASTVVIDNVEIEYNDMGSGAPLVFVHGLYVTGALWDDVAARLSERTAALCRPGHSARNVSLLVRV